MTEKDIERTLRGDANLREAVSRREQKLPPGSSHLNDQLLQRIEPRTANSWRWVAAAACLLVLIGIGFTLLPSEETLDTKPVAPIVAKAGPAPTAQPLPSHEEERPSPPSTLKPQPQTPPIKRKGATAHPHPQMAVQPAAPEEESDDAVDSVKMVKEMLKMPLPPQHYMAQAPQMNGSLQDEYQEMSREIRERGERMTQQVEMALSDD